MHDFIRKQLWGRATNKNNYVLFFLDYLVKIKKFCQELELCFLIPGHTKFSVDRFFGVMRNKLYSFCDSLETYSEIIDFIQNTSVQIITFTTSEKCSDNCIKIYDWKEYLLPHYKKVSASIKLFVNYHFSVSTKFENVSFKKYFGT